MKKVLLDTNVVLDIALQRPNFYEHAKSIFNLIKQNKIIALVSATTVTDIFYVLKREKLDAFKYLKELLKVIDVLNVDKEIILNALYSGWTDFEDAVQSQVAIENNINIIVTRNTKDFQKSENIEILTPKDFIVWVEKIG